MIRKLQHKIVAIITSLLTLVIIVVLVAINMLAQASSEDNINRRLDQLSRGDIMPRTGGLRNNAPDAAITSDYFIIQLDLTFNMLTFTTNRDGIVLTDEILEAVNEALQSGNETGTIGTFAYLIRMHPNGRTVVFMDISFYTSQNRNLLLTTVAVGAVAVGVFLGIAIALSFWLIRPVKRSLDKQKLFISNASHELKTPLAVIGANSDVLLSEIGENKWLGYIRSETERMAELVNELLCLARLDDKGIHQLTMQDACLSDIVMQTALPFESRMFEEGKTFETDVDPDINMKCDPSVIKHIVSILIDNAAKYSDKGAQVRVSLKMHGGKRRLEVFNTGRGIPADKLDKIFERFYREDEVRNSSSGGYGLGLAIAKASVEAHGGTISAQSEYGSWALFTVTL